MAPDELVVNFNPIPAAERVANYHGMMRSRAIWFGVALVLCLVLYVWQRDSLSVVSTVLLFVVGLGGSLVWLGFAVVMWQLCRRSLRALGEGVAVRIGRQGIEVTDRFVAWDQIERVSTQRGPICVGPRLTVVERGRSAYLVPLTYLDALPGTLDSALRAYSGGRVSLDVTHLDN